MDAVLFSKLRRRVRGMSIRLARQIMKNADRNEDGHIDLREAQMIAFEQEGIGAGDVVEMLASVDDNNDGELNAPEFADFERIVRARAVETSRKALRVVDTDGSGTLTMDEAKRIAFDHYGFDERTLEPFFAQADENEDGNLDAVEFAGFRSVIRGRAVKNAQNLLPEIDTDGDGFVSNVEAEEKARREDDMDPKETFNLYNVADQDKNGVLDKVELADFVRLVRLSAIKYANDHFREFDTNRDKKVTLEELQTLTEEKYSLDPATTAEFFSKVDVDFSGDLNPGEIVDFRHEVRKFVADREARLELENQHRREMAEIEEKLRKEAEARQKLLAGESESTTSKAVVNSHPAEDGDENEDFEEDEEEEVVTTVAPKLKKKKLRKHKDQPPTTTETPETKEINEEIEDTEQGDSEEKLVRDSTLEDLTEKNSENGLPQSTAAFEDAENVTPVAQSSFEVTEAAVVETSPLISSIQESAETTTTAVFELTEAPSTANPLETSTLKKRRKIKKLRLKTTTPATEEGTIVDKSETTAVAAETTQEPVKVSPESTTVSTVTTTELTTPSTTDLLTTAVETISVTETEYEEEEEVSTTTTQKPKRRRLRKKPAITTTTTTVAPEEDYEEGEEEEAEEPSKL
uniref:EF-hand domain-containing protein n=1 Tax=Panagrolaimus davidi TaxID=227884 RepID=A0A914PNC8_9BILA